MSVVDLRVSFFESIFEEKNEHVPIGQILTDIQCGRWALLVRDVRQSKNREAKNKLPSAYFAGRFAGRNLSTLIEYNGIFTLDFDKVGRDLEEFRNALMADPHIITAFISPSGNGMKALLQVNCRMEEHKGYAFSYLQWYARDVWGIEIDPKTKNINRHCFMSSDENMIIHEHAMPLEIPIWWEEPTTYNRNARKAQDYQVSHDAEYIFDVLVRWANKNGSYKIGNRNNFIFNLVCNCNRYGIPKEMTEGLIASRYRSFDENELKACLLQYERAKDEFGSKQMVDFSRKINQQSLL